ncbi:MAG: hypothetical protein EPO27_01980 [Betaproteobacteria bacterium]|nr:MAG: hypothetical protein EPO27_01980 [Betaproteobacteria bacterium]
MKRLLPWLLVLASAAALAQEGRGRAHGPGPRGHPAMQQPMAPRGGMSWEERQRLREELKSGRRDDFRGRPHADPRRQPPPMAPEDRERLRRDLRDANRDLGRRR